MENILYKAMLSKIQKDIKDNAEEIQKIKQIDMKYCKIKVEVDKLFEIIENYKEIKISNKDERIMVLCNGNPYIVVNLIMIAITNNLTIKIDIDDTMIGVNKYIIQIIKNVLKSNNIKIEIEIVRKIDNETNIVCIDRVNDFTILKKKCSNIKFIPYQAIDIYSEGIECEELLQKIYEYAIEMNIDIDVFDDEGIDGMFKYGMAKKKVILSKGMTRNYKDENVYVNENPFKNGKVTFDKKMIEQIINAINSN